MKKFFIATAAVALVASAGVTDANAGLQDNVGCGLGTVLLADQGDSFLTRMAATTTNGILANQLFAISTGTLGCSAPDGIAMNETEKFVAENMDNLAKDIAMGQGESLDTLRVLMEVEASQADAFKLALQENFDNIYSTESVEAFDVIASIESVKSSI